MSVQEIIEAINLALQEMVSEQQLRKQVNTRLVALRQIYKTDHKQFSHEQIVFLQSVARIIEELDLLQDISKRIASTFSLDEYFDLRKELLRLQKVFHGMAVCQRVNKELREIQEKASTLAGPQKATSSKSVRRLSGLQKKCPNGHEMILREGGHGTFWGCSKFPVCKVSSALSTDEQKRLNK